jgi:hypothetical protein
MRLSPFPVKLSLAFPVSVTSFLTLSTYAVISDLETNFHKNCKLLTKLHPGGGGVVYRKGEEY